MEVETEHQQTVTPTKAIYTDEWGIDNQHFNLNKTTELSARISNDLPDPCRLSRPQKYALWYPSWKKLTFQYVNRTTAMIYLMSREGFIGSSRQFSIYKEYMRFKWNHESLFCMGINNLPC